MGTEVIGIRTDGLEESSIWLYSRERWQAAVCDCGQVSTALAYRELIPKDQERKASMNDIILQFRIA